MANDPSYQDKFLMNTGLGIMSLAVPEVGAGVLIYDLGRTGVELNNAFWESAPVNNWFQDLYNDMDRWIYQSGQ